MAKRAKPAESRTVEKVTPTPPRVPLASIKTEASHADTDTIWLDVVPNDKGNENAFRFSPTGRLHLHMVEEAILDKIKTGEAYIIEIYAAD